MQQKLITVALIAILGGMLAWKFWPENPKLAIVKQVNALAETLNKAPGEGNVTLIAKTEGFGRLFAPQVIVEVPPVTGHYTPEELKSYAARIRSGQPSIDIFISRLEVTMVDETHAYATFRARLVAGGAGEDRGEDTRAIRADFSRIEDKWLITAIAPDPSQE